MNILTVDTGTRHLICSLGTEERFIQGVFSGEKRTHSQHIIQAIEELLAKAKLSLDDIDVFGASEGPGSFTGLRIGIATIQGLAFAKNKPCIKVNTLDALAEFKKSRGNLLLTFLDARNRRVYAKAFWGEETLLEANVGSIEDFVREVQARLSEKGVKDDNPNTYINRIILAADDSGKEYAEDEVLLEFLPKAEIEVAAPYFTPEALHQVAIKELRAERYLQPEELLPEYYAPTEAERNLAQGLEQDLTSNKI